MEPVSRYSKKLPELFCPIHHYSEQAQRLYYPQPRELFVLNRQGLSEKHTFGYIYEKLHQVIQPRIRPTISAQIQDVTQQPELSSLRDLILSSACQATCGLGQSTMQRLPGLAGCTSRALTLLSFPTWKTTAF